MMEQATRSATTPLSSGRSYVTLRYACQICGQVISVEFGPMAICQECGRRLKKLLYEEEEK